VIVGGLLLNGEIPRICPRRRSPSRDPNVAFGDVVLLEEKIPRFEGLGSDA